MLKVMSSAFGISSDKCMKIAENLYLGGYITYPRTESTQYSENFEFMDIVNSHKGNSEWGGYAQ
jgi:DNA topoisomerase-3